MVGERLEGGTCSGITPTRSAYTAGMIRAPGLRLDADRSSLHSQVIEVRDARIPLSSACGHLEALIQVALSHFIACARDPFWLAPSRMLSLPPMLPKRAESSGTESRPVCAEQAPRDRPEQERPHQPQRTGNSPTCLAPLALTTTRLSGCDPLHRSSSV